MYSHFNIEGNKPLRGEVQVSGSKNAALPMIFSTILSSGTFTIKNIPEISDIYKTIKILEYLGSEITFENNTLHINNAQLEYKDLPTELTGKMRASIWAISPLLARFGKAKTAFPGGCVIGKRPVGSHIKALYDLGAIADTSNPSSINLQTKGLKGNTIVLREMSVSATINAIIAATLAEGETTIKVAAPEPEVQNICEFLNTCGAKITGIGTNTVRIQGVEAIGSCEWTNIPDRIEAGTFACLAAFVDNSDIRITGLRNDHLDMFWARMEDLGVEFILPNNHTAEVKAKALYKADDLFQHCTTSDSRVYPHFPTDLQSPFTLLFTKSEGISKVFDTIFEGRLAYLSELEKMGAKTQVLNPHQAMIVGPTPLKGTELQSFDLRAGATMVMAALGARGKSRVYGIDYIDRGYEKFEEKLRALGADITRVKEEQ